ILYYALKVLVTQPLRNLTSRVDQINKDISQTQRSSNLERRSDRNHDEMSTLFLAFVRMRRALKQTYSALHDEQAALAEKAYEADAANRAKSEFLANISHEFRTPLHAIVSFSDIGSRKASAADPESSRRYFKKIATSGERLISLVENLLDLSKLESRGIGLHLQTASIHQLVDVAVDESQTVANDKDIAILVSQPPHDISCELDVDRCHHVLTHLLDNAIKFSNIGSEITVTVTMVDSGASQGVEVSVEDRGIGIPDGEAGKIFETFSQSSNVCNKAGGISMGLAISRRVIEQHGGKLWAEEGREVGAKFVLRLPLAPSAAEAA
ncbi:MAG: HAMP domain-containing sensor histidine kinase, partial [Pseudomonadota bacterium]